MAIQPYTKKTYLNEDQRWVAPGGIHDLENNCDSVVLDRSLFNLTVTFPNGFVPSGVVLARVTASGLHGPYDNAATDGREVAAGHLAVSQELDRDQAATADELVPLYWRGEVDESYLPTGHGLDAAAKTDLQRIRYV